MSEMKKKMSEMKKKMSEMKKNETNTPKICIKEVKNNMMMIISKISGRIDSRIDKVIVIRGMMIKKVSRIEVIGVVVVVVVVVAIDTSPIR